MKFDKGLMAGSGTMLILSLLEGGDMYGYQMIEELSRRSNDLFQMKEGTLYPILHGLEREEAPGRQAGGVGGLPAGGGQRAVRRGQRPGVRAGLCGILWRHTRG